MKMLERRLLEQHQSTTTTTTTKPTTTVSKTQTGSISTIESTQKKDSKRTFSPPKNVPEITAEVTIGDLRAEYGQGKNNMRPPGDWFKPTLDDSPASATLKLKEVTAEEVIHERSVVLEKMSEVLNPSTEKKKYKETLEKMKEEELMREREEKKKLIELMREEAN